MAARKGLPRPGARNKVPEERLKHIGASGELPLDYMLWVTPTADDRRRDEIAKSVAFYVHPEVQTVDPKRQSRPEHQRPADIR